MRIVAENFQSWANLDFTVPDATTIINGFNFEDNTSEGSGKSSILNAMCWGLYGKVPKSDVRIDDVIMHGKKHCSVEVILPELSVYRVRKSGANDLYYMLGSDPTPLRGKDMRETQELIERKLNLTFDTFCQSLYFPQEYPNKFITANQETKAKILSEIQNLQQYDTARDLVKKQLNTLTKNLQEITKSANIAELTLKEIQDRIVIRQQQKSGLINEHNKKIEQLTKIFNNTKLKFDQENELLTVYKEDLANKYSNELCPDPVHTSDIKAITDQLADVKAQILSIDKQDKLVKSWEQATNNFKLKLINLEHQIRDRLDELKETKANFEATTNHIKHLTEQEHQQNCPTCGQHWPGGVNTVLADETKKLGKIQVQINSLESKVKVLNKDYKETKELQRLHVIEVPEKAPDAQHLNKIQKELNLKYTELTNNKLAYESFIKNKEMLEYKINQSTETLKGLKQTLKELIADKKQLDQTTLDFTEIDTDIALQEERALQQQTILNETKTQVSDLEYKIKQLDTLKDAFREVKTWIFENALKVLNEKVNFYLKELYEVPVSLEFITDGFKIETVATINGIEQSLGLFSGGQTKRLSIAINLAISELTRERSNTCIPILILDEPFKDLSETSMERVVNLLSLRKEPTLFIEHNSILQSIVSNSVFVEYRNGVSNFAAQ